MRKEKVIMFSKPKLQLSTGLTFYVLTDSSFWVDTINLGWSIVLRPHIKLYNAAFHLGPHCLLKYKFRSHLYIKG